MTTKAELREEIRKFRNVGSQMSNVKLTQFLVGLILWVMGLLSILPVMGSTILRNGPHLGEAIGLLACAVCVYLGEWLMLRGLWWPLS